MPKNLRKSLVENWIKNVYSQRTQTGITSEQLHTGSSLTHQFTFPTVHKSLLTPLFVLVVNTQFYTAKNHQFNLLYSHLYPQSTAPINMKKKERKEKNT